MDDRKPFGSFAPVSPYIDPAAGAPRTSAVTYNTPLPVFQEMAFRDWVKKNNVPFNPDAPGPSDYDMRGFYQGMQNGDPRATTAVDPNDSRVHYTDPWKTPLHQTFGAQSQWATPVAPQWTGEDKLISPGGRIIYDDRNQPSQMDPVALMRAALGRQ